jgi:hypothetical protein
MDKRPLLPTMGTTPDGFVDATPYSLARFPSDRSEHVAHHRSIRHHANPGNSSYSVILRNRPSGDPAAFEADIMKENRT